MAKFTKEQQVDIFLLVAMMRCFNEQLYNIKGTHSQKLKMIFNNLVKTSRRYENEVLKWTENNDNLEVIYDNMMDVLVQVKQQIDIKDEERID